MLFVLTLDLKPDLNRNSGVLSEFGLVNFYKILIFKSVREILKLDYVIDVRVNTDLFMIDSISVYVDQPYNDIYDLEYSLVYDNIRATLSRCDIDTLSRIKYVDIKVFSHFNVIFYDKG